MADDARRPMTRPEMEAEARRLLAELMGSGKLVGPLAAYIERGLARRLARARRANAPKANPEGAE